MGLVLGLFLVSNGKINVMVNYFLCSDTMMPFEYSIKMTKMFLKPLCKDTLFNVIFSSSKEDSVYDILLTGEFSLKGFTDIDIGYSISTKGGFFIEKKVVGKKLNEVRKNLKESIYEAITSLWIQSFPDSAMVYIDNVKYGCTPLYVAHIPKGVHSIKISKPLYSERDTVLNVLGLDTLVVRLERKKEKEAWIVLSSLPYVEILVDGRLFFVSTDNSAFKISPGMHEIIIRHPIYGEKKIIKEVKGGERIYVDIFE